MILTISTNPSVDIVYNLSKLSLNAINRTNYVEKVSGGKAIHVSNILRLLGEKVAISGFLGGINGEFIYNDLKKINNMDKFFIKISDNTRNCITILHDNNDATEIREEGPFIEKIEQDKFIEGYKNYIHNYDTVVISGSSSRNIDEYFYKKIIEITKKHQKFIAMDIDPKSLSAIKSHLSNIDLLKMNIGYFEKFTKKKYLFDKKEILDELKSDLYKDIKFVVITMRENGAVFKIYDNYYIVNIGSFNKVSSVGSGEATMAGLIYSIKKNLDHYNIIKTAISCGISNAKEGSLDFINVGMIEDIKNSITIKRA